MKTAKLLKIAKEYLSLDVKKAKKQKACIKELLQKLKKKKRHLKEQLAQEKSDKERKRIKKDLDILFAQYKKGLKTLKALK
jgi:hypothetical protein